jgi:putative membrane protein
MKRIQPVHALIIAALALSGVAWAANEASAPVQQKSPGTSELGKLDRHDQEFLRKATAINLTEIELGKVAEKASTDPKLKKYASTIIKDHTDANQKLARLAASKGYALPNQLSSWDRHELSSLEKQQGDKFHRDFVAFNIKGHEKAIALYQKQVAKGQDPDIKAFAEKMIPHLQEHLAMVQNGTLEAVGENSQQIQKKQGLQAPQQSQKANQ